MGGTARAQLVLDEQVDQYDLTSHTELLQDRGRAWRIEDVTAPPLADSFVPLDPHQKNLGYTESAYFLRFTLENPSNAPVLWYLEPYRGVEKIDFYRPLPGGGFFHTTTGSGVSLADRALYDPALLLPVPLAAGERVTLILREETANSVRFFDSLWSRHGIESRLIRDWSVIGLFYGAMLALLLYNLFMFVSLRDSAYLYYALFQLSLLFMEGTNDDLTHSWLWPHWPRWRVWSDAFFANLSLSGGVGFARSFLALAKSSPRLDRWVRRLQIVAVMMALGFPFSRTAFYQKLALLFLMVTCIALAGIGLYAWWRGNRVARYFFAGWSLLIGFSVISVLVLLGVFQMRWWSTEDTLKLAAVSEAVLLSFGLAARVDQLRRERDRVAAEWQRAQEARLGALGRLVAGVAHEIGNPLNFSVGGAIDVKRRLERLDGALHSQPPDLDGARTTLGEAQRAAALVTNGNERIRVVLAHLRNFSGGRESPSEPIDVAVSLEKTLEMMAPRIELQSIRVVRNLQSLPHVSCRGGELEQVFMNLMLNSCQAMPEGGELRIDARAGDGWVEVQLSDTGPGIPPEHREAIFDPFFTTRAPSEGSGLGLSVSYEIVRRHGGELRLAKSERGASLIVRMPAAEKQP